MERIIYIVVTLILAVNLQAQKVDSDGLKLFLNDIKALEGEHVEFECSGLEGFFDEIRGKFPGELTLDQDMLSIYHSSMDYMLGGLITSSYEFVQVASLDEVGYDAICEVLDKYDVTATEELFGIPLTANNREDGEQQIVFIDEQNTFLVNDEGGSIEIIYGNFNILDILRNIITSLINDFGNGILELKTIGGIGMNFAIDNNGTDMSALGGMQKDKPENFRFEVEGLCRPSFIEDPLTGKTVVAIPKVSSEIKWKMQPYAAYNIYDWINETGFGKGAEESEGQVSGIITPYDIAKEYAVRNLPSEKWLDEGYSEEKKELFSLIFQGGTPAVLYRFSLNDAGYDDMLSDLGLLLGLEEGDTYKNLEVLQQITRSDGKRLVQLFGEGGVIMCLYDSPVDKYCHMSIQVGGGEFGNAVNDYAFGGERNIAEKCNVIIDCNQNNNLYGIHFTTDEYWFAGKSHTNGVHIDFGYSDKLK